MQRSHYSVVWRALLKKLKIDAEQSPARRTDKWVLYSEAPRGETGLKTPSCTRKNESQCRVGGPIK